MKLRASASCSEAKNGRLQQLPVRVVLSVLFKICDVAVRQRLACNACLRNILHTDLILLRHNKSFTMDCVRYYILSLTTIELFEENVGYRSWRVTIGAQTKGAPYYFAPAAYDWLIRNSTNGARQGYPSDS